jgi:hypothetical protein
MMDRFSKTCLCLIVLLLTVIALRPYVAPQPVRAATQHKYAVGNWHDFGIPATDGGTSVLKQTLNNDAAAGWELVAAVPLESCERPGSSMCTYTLTKSVLLIEQK